MTALASLPPESLSLAESLILRGEILSNPEYLHEYLSGLSRQQQVVIRHDWSFWGRPDQQLPLGDDWDVFVPMGGRGAGKTRCGGELVHNEAAKPNARGLIVARTANEANSVVIRSLLESQKPWNPCYHHKHDKVVVWPRTGAIADIRSGDQPESIRGVHAQFAWVDEYCKFQYPGILWEQLEMAVRAPPHPRFIVTTTPRPIPAFKALVADKRTVVTRASTFRNRAHLAASTLRRLAARYGGTELARQELYAEIIGDSEGALWRRAWIEAARTASYPVLDWIAVGVDPPGGLITECGIVATGRHGSPLDGDLYVLADDSLSGHPDVWARQVWATAIKTGANEIVAEMNHGGLMVEATLNACRPSGCWIPIRPDVHASESKQARAQPFALLAEQGRMHHVGNFSELEDEMTSWIPFDDETGKRMASPNRIDACVWAGVGCGMGVTEQYVEIW